jgi:hypothetical protein
MTQKLPTYLEAWIMEQQPEVLESKLEWIRGEVIPWILSESNQQTEPSSQE